MRIREIESDPEEIRLVAERMRLTLMEVLGEERGGSMYTVKWLVSRVQFHLSVKECIGAVFVAENDEGRVVGHALVRLDYKGREKIGLFSTFYVEPESRRKGVASMLVDRGELWMREQGETMAVTYTDENNEPLKRLMGRHGYRLEPMPKNFVALVKELNPPAESL